MEHIRFDGGVIRDSPRGRFPHERVAAGGQVKVTRPLVFSRTLSSARRLACRDAYLVRVKTRGLVLVLDNIPLPPRSYEGI